MARTCLQSETHEGTVLRFLKLGSLLRKGVPQKVFLNGRGSLEAGDMRVVLSWGEFPLDLDLHCVNDKGGHVYWSKPSAEGMSMDIDVRNGHGPETLTLKPRRGGAYRIWVRVAASGPTETSRLWVGLRCLGPSLTVPVLPSLG